MVFGAAFLSHGGARKGHDRHGRSGHNKSEAEFEAAQDVHEKPRSEQKWREHGPSEAVDGRDWEEVFIQHPTKDGDVMVRKVRG